MPLIIKFIIINNEVNSNLTKQMNLSIKKTIRGILALSLVSTQYVSAVERSYFYPPGPEEVSQKNTQKKEEEVKKGPSEIGNGLTSQEGTDNDLQNCNEVPGKGKNYNKNQRRKKRISEKKEAGIEEQKNKDVVFLKSEEVDNKGLNHEQSLLLTQPVSAIDRAKTEKAQIGNTFDEQLTQIGNTFDEQLRTYFTSKEYTTLASTDIKNILDRMNSQCTEKNEKTIFNFHAKTDSELKELTTNLNKLEYFEGNDQCGQRLIYPKAMGKDGDGFAQPFNGPAGKMMAVLVYLGGEGNLNQEDFDKDFFAFFNLVDIMKNEASTCGARGLKILLEKYVRIKLPSGKSMQSPHNKKLKEDQEEGKE